MISYVDVIGDSYPGLKLVAYGDGQTYSSLIAAPGFTVPPQSELDAKRLVMCQNIAWRRIQLERDRRKNNGVKIGTNWFHTDDASRIQHLGLVMMGANLPANVMWKTMAGTFVQMTQTLAGQIFQAVAAQDIAIFTVAEQKRVAMMALADPEKYDYKSGWPLTFGE